MVLVMITNFADLYSICRPFSLMMKPCGLNNQNCIVSLLGNVAPFSYSHL